MGELKNHIVLKSRLKEAGRARKKDTELLQNLQNLWYDTTWLKTDLTNALNEKIRKLWLEEQDRDFERILPKVKKLEGTPEWRWIQLSKAQDSKYITMLKVFSSYQDYYTIIEELSTQLSEDWSDKLTKELVLWTKIDFKKIPQWFRTKHSILAEDWPIGVKQLFVDSEPLLYLDDKYRRTTRILYTTEWTVLSRRTNKKLMKFVNPTQAEKRKFELNHILNSHGDEFAAIRAQKFISEKAQQWVSFYNWVAKAVQKVMADINAEIMRKKKWEWIDEEIAWEIQEKLAIIQQDLSTKKNYEAARAAVRALYKWVVPNGRLYQSLYGASNDVSRRVAELSHMFVTIDLQKNGMEQRLERSKDGMHRLRTSLLEHEKKGSDANTWQNRIIQLYKENKLPGKTISQPRKGYLHQLVKAKKLSNIHLKTLIALQQLHAQTYERQDHIAFDSEFALELSELQAHFDDMVGITTTYNELKTLKKNDASYEDLKDTLLAYRADIEQYINITLK